MENEVFTNIHLGNMEDVMENEISNIMHSQLENVNEVSFLLRAENIQYVQDHCKRKKRILLFRKMKTKSFKLIATSNNLNSTFSLMLFLQRRLTI